MCIPNFNLPVYKNNVLSKSMSLVIKSLIESLSSCFGIKLIGFCKLTSFSLPSASTDGRNTINIRVPKPHTTANTVNTNVLVDSFSSVLSRRTNIIKMFPMHILSVCPVCMERENQNNINKQTNINASLRSKR